MIYVPLLLGELITSYKGNKKQNIKVLLDSGASGTIISSQFTKLLNLQSGKRCKWNTMAGSFTTKHDCLINFNLPELHPTASIKYLVHVTPHMANMI